MSATNSKPAAADWEVYVMEYARTGNQAVASLLFGAFDEGTIDLPFAFVLARRGGVNVLIDTGFMREGRGVQMAAAFGIRDWVSPLTFLRRLGVGAQDVGHIVISHAHWDHMGSIEQFPTARIYLQKSELLSWVELMALPPQFGALTGAIDPDDFHAALHAAEEHRLTLLEGDRDDVLPGLHVRFAPDGHTPGQQYVLIDTPRGRLAITGDAVYTSRNLTGTGNNGVYIPLGLGVGSVWGELKTMDQIQRDIDGDLSRMVTLHDFERWKNLDVVAEIESLRIFKAA
jgi:glyoxylase-like metal-dependent hydrolase (beta-lactamase superfamily II)